MIIYGILRKFLKIISLGNHYIALRSIIYNSQIKLANPYVTLLWQLFLFVLPFYIICIYCYFAMDNCYAWILALTCSISAKNPWKAKINTRRNKRTSLSLSGCVRDELGHLNQSVVHSSRTNIQTCKSKTNG